MSLSPVSLSSINVVASNTDAISALTVNPVKQSTGSILELNENGGKIQEDGTGIVRDFIRPVVSDVITGERYEFFKIIQSTPQGERVIIILTTKLP